MLAAGVMLAASWGALAAAPVQITEFMPEDATVLPDEDGDYRGWIELHNRGAEPVSLEDFGLSDDTTRPFKWRFPQVILRPDERLVVFVTGKDRREPPVLPAPAPDWLPSQLPGLLLWLDAAASETLDLDAGLVCRWRDRTGRPFENPPATPLSPDQIGGLMLWLDADDAQTLEWRQGARLGWQDKSGHNRHAVAPSFRANPTWTAGANARRYLRFDGADDHLELPRLEGICTVLWVAREDATVQEYAALLGHHEAYDFHPGERRVILEPNFRSSVSGWINGVEVDPYRTLIPRELALVTLMSTNAARVSLLGSDRLLTNRFWRGDLGELVCFDRVLTKTERASVEAWLLQKWQPHQAPPPAHYDAVQDEPTRRPRLIHEPLSGLTALRFDGEDDHLLFPRLDNVQSVFWVAHERPTPSGQFPVVVGDTIRYGLHRGDGGKIYHYLWTAGEVLDGQTWLDGLSLDPLVTRLPEKRLLLGTQATGSLPLGTVGSGRLLERYFWGGDIHEILLFDRQLSDAERSSVENYLMARWRLPDRRLHTNFELNPAGGWLVLTAPSGLTVDVVPPVAVPPRISYARAEAGSRDFAFCPEPTPGRANESPLFGSLTEPPGFDPPGGFFDQQVEVQLTAAPDAVIYYTLDGSVPLADPGGTSQVYQAPLILKTGAVVRALAVRPGALPSAVITRPYLAGPKPALPVVSLAADPVDLWSEERGIYATGPGASQYPPYLGANYHKAWERAAEFTFLETNGLPAYHAGAGLRIHGSYTRAAPQKSFRLYARRQYGAGSFRHAFFPGQAVDRFEALVLRNAGNDWSYARMRDRLGQALGAELGVDHAQSRPVAVYLNGVYWGQYYLMERADEHFLAEHNGLGEQDLVVVANGTEIPVGDHRDYVRLRADCWTLDLREPANLESVLARLDLNSLLDYHITQIHLDNSDWPTHNTILWRPRRPDGQWRWVLLDLDGTFDILKQGFTRPTLRIALGLEPEFAASYPATVFLPQLLQNPGFRDTFLNRFADALNSVFAPAHVLERINTLAAELEPEMERHLARWRPEATYYWPVHTNLAAWQAEVEHLRAFARERPAAMRRQLVEHFGLAGTAELLVRVNDPARGRVRVNSLRLPAGTREWSGLYFRGVPVEVEALPEPGAEFAGWEELPDAPALMRLALDGVVELTAAFQPAGEPVPLPRPFALWQGEYRFDALPADTPPGTYPPAMIFLQTATRDPGLDAAFETPWTLPYSLTSRSRVSGLDGRGVSFLNTGNPQESSGAGYLGAVVLALNTEGVRRVRVTWTSGTVTPNSRPYALRLQYRVGDAGPFADVTDAAGRPLEYRRSPVAGDFAVLGPVELPAAVDDRPLVQLRWVYHRTGEGPDSGARDELRLDDIRVSAEPAPPKLRVVQELLTRRYWLEAAGLYRRPARVQSSDDLVHWTDEGAIEGGWDGRAARPLDPPPPETARFYRLRLP